MQPYSVSGLNLALNEILGSHFSSVSVQGELAQIQVPGSGHAYFTLRDDKGSLGAVCWRTNWQSQNYRPKVGEQVVCRGKIGVYSPQGRYQLYVTHVAPVGEGAWAKELAARKQRLEAEGLLDPRRKRPLPKFPRIVGVATSLTGAALQDFLKVSRHRFPGTRILVAGCTVQGKEAPGEILRAVELLIEDGRSDVIVVTRGGGSKSDLIAFQDEQLARFLAHSPVPVLSAVGHQVDSSLCDLVADAVAATPSDAALMALPDGEMLSQQVDDWLFMLESAAGRIIDSKRAQLSSGRARLRHPGDRLQQVRSYAQQLQTRLTFAMNSQLQTQQMLIRGCSGRLVPSMAHRLERKHQGVESLESQLKALSPYAVLERGYAIVSGPNGVVRGADQVADGEKLSVKVHRGDFRVQVLGESRGS